MSAAKPSEKKPFENSDQWITLFADASFCHQTLAYGWCFWLKHGSPAKTHIHSGGGIKIASSHWAEVEALRQGLKMVETMELKGKRVVVQSDCTGALAVIVPELLRLKDAGAAAAYSKHVKGHQGNGTPRSSVNTTCDKRARAEMKTYRELVRADPPPRRPKASRP